eukprot:CAMPEP_0184866620 /NCGR_PEP_ID=MMETSP0580-20130426/22983_1 /TAXON_ID=1118495 /ORGANISM="Dactyliosolen fragilissimus" /LENGTH=1190 /DNA_ID=CAMNT_0027366393 /DNA_START=260 /DNA_END=3832 /DNA_ORIENTATION=-
MSDEGSGDEYNSTDQDSQFHSVTSRNTTSNSAQSSSYAGILTSAGKTLTGACGSLNDTIDEDAVPTRLSNRPKSLIEHAQGMVCGNNVNDLNSPNGGGFMNADDDEMSIQTNPMSALFARALIQEVTNNPSHMTPSAMAERERRLMKAQKRASEAKDRGERVVGTPGGTGFGNGVLGAVTNFALAGNDNQIAGPGMAGKTPDTNRLEHLKNNLAASMMNSASKSMDADDDAEPIGKHRITLGLSLSRRHAKVGHPDTVTRQTAFDFNELQDRSYKYVSSTDSSGWRAGGGEGAQLRDSQQQQQNDGNANSIGNAPSEDGDSNSHSNDNNNNSHQQHQSHKVAAPDTVHIPIIHIDCDSLAVIDSVIAALARGEVFIPHMSVLPESLGVNGVSPPDLVVRFGCERNEDVQPEDWSNWCLEFMHNQLFEYFLPMGAKWMKRPFQITLARKVRWKTVKHMNKFFAHSERVINNWREKGPRYLDPQLTCIDGGASHEEVSRPHGLYLLRNGKPTNYFPPNFDPPYTTKMTRSLLLNVIGKSWDTKKRDWTSKPVPRSITPSMIFTTMCGCSDVNQGGFVPIEATQTLSPMELMQNDPRTIQKKKMLQNMERSKSFGSNNHNNKNSTRSVSSSGSYSNSQDQEEMHISTPDRGHSSSYRQNKNDEDNDEIEPKSLEFTHPFDNKPFDSPTHNNNSPYMDFGNFNTPNDEEGKKSKHTTESSRTSSNNDADDFDNEFSKIEKQQVLDAFGFPPFEMDSSFQNEDGSSSNPENGKKEKDKSKNKDKVQGGEKSNQNEEQHQTARKSNKSSSSGLKPLDESAVSLDHFNTDMAKALAQNIELKENTSGENGNDMAVSVGESQTTIPVGNGSSSKFIEQERERRKQRELERAKERKKIDELELAIKEKMNRPRASSSKKKDDSESIDSKEDGTEIDDIDKELKDKKGKNMSGLMQSSKSKKEKKKEKREKKKDKKKKSKEKTKESSKIAIEESGNVTNDFMLSSDFTEDPFHAFASNNGGKDMSFGTGLDHISKTADSSFLPVNLSSAFSENDTFSNYETQHSPKQSNYPQDAKSQVSLDYSMDNSSFLGMGDRSLVGQQFAGDGSVMTNGTHDKSLISSVTRSTIHDSGNDKIKQTSSEDDISLSILESNSSVEPIPSDEELFAVGWAKALDPNSGSYYYFTLDRSKTVWENPLENGI